MAKRLKPKFKKRFAAVVLLLVFVFIASIFISQNKQLHSESAQLADINSQITAAQQKNNSLTNEDSLAVTDQYKESVAKNRDGLVFPGELIFVDAFASN